MTPASLVLEPDIAMQRGFQLSAGSPRAHLIIESGALRLQHLEPIKLYLGVAWGEEI